MKVAICWCDEGSKNASTQLAVKLGLPLFNAADNVPLEYSHLLTSDAAGLALRLRDPLSLPAPAPTRVDFLDGTLQYRLRTSGKRQGLGKAVGLEKAAGIRVLDATAGLGRDALVLAHLGCEVTLLERNPLVHALLEDGMARARSEPALQPLLARMQLLHCEARTHFAAIRAGTAAVPEVIYLDPMFPPRDKSASVKKDMALLQAMLGVEEDFAGLLGAARECAKYRVVVKRPGNREFTDVPTPTFAVPGKAARFEVYVNSSFSSTPR